MISRKIAIGLLVVLALSGCSQEPSAPTEEMTVDKEASSSLLDASLWVTPYSEGSLDFALPDELTFLGGMDADDKHTGIVIDAGSSDGFASDYYFSLTSYALIKCAPGLEECGLDEIVEATPQEVFEKNISRFSEIEDCTDKGDIPVGNVIGRLFSCGTSPYESVFFHGTEGSYHVQTPYDLKNPPVDRALDSELFRIFMSTFKVK